MKRPLTVSLLALGLLLGLTPCGPVHAQSLPGTPVPYRLSVRLPGSVPGSVRPVLREAQALSPAPAEPRNAYTQLVDSVSQPLDKSRVPTGILLDRILGLAGLRTFAPGQLSAGAHFRQSYYDLWTAAYVRPAALLPYTQPVLVGLARKLIQQGQLPVGVLDARFAVLDTLAEERRSIIESDGLYYDGWPWLSPYQSRSVCLVSPLADTTAARTTFTLPAALLFQNTDRTPSQVQVQVGSLAFTLRPGGSYAADLGLPGDKTLTFTVLFSDGTQARSQATVYVRPTPGSRATSAVEEDITPNIIGRSWTSYDGISTYGEGNGRRYYNSPASKSDHKLRNLVVVLDGYDPGDRRDIPRVLADFTPLMQAFGQPGQERDVVILNFPMTDRPVQTPLGAFTFYQDGGADYIERNALVVVELLSRLKPLMSDPAQKVTIVGPSMGGLVSRYALALMEKNFAASQDAYWQHNVDTWISLDTPHGGANVPLGDQYFLDYFRGVSEPARENYERLSSPAARQMLVNHCQDQNGDYFRKPFLRNLAANGLPGSGGYPTQLRRVGLSNGAMNGLLNAEVGYAGQTGVQLDVVHDGTNRGSRSFFYRSTEPGAQISANMYFSPGFGQTGPVFDGQARLIVSAARNVLRRIHRVVSSTANGSYDIVAGGIYNSQDQIRTLTLARVPLPGMTYVFSSMRPIHCFIPTVSALAFQYRNTAAYDGSGLLPSPTTDLSTRALRCNDETPFDAIYAEPQFNTMHVMLTAGAQQFLAREFYNVTQPARFAANNARVLCQGSAAVLTLADCVERSGTATYNWTLTGPGQFTATGSASAPNGGLSQAVSATGAGIIRCSVVVTRPGAAPSPATSWTVSTTATSFVTLRNSTADAAVCISSTLTVSATPQAGAVLSGWRVANGTLLGWNGNDAQVQVSDVAGVTVVYADYNASCPGASGPPVPATAESRISVVNSQNGLFCAGQNGVPAVQAAYPIPADASLTVRAPFSGTGTYRLELFNERGARVYANATASGEVRVDTHALPVGLYHLTLRQGTLVRRLNLNIQR